MKKSDFIAMELLAIVVGICISFAKLGFWVTFGICLIVIAFSNKRVW